MGTKIRRGIVEAAGGLLWRTDAARVLLAVIHRPKYHDWSLPKGKLKKNESWSQAALREVQEETGFVPMLAGFAGCVGYCIKGDTPKIVLFWHMTVGKGRQFRPDDINEVDGLEWLPVEQALNRLSYADERRLLQQALGSAPKRETTA